MLFRSDLTPSACQNCHGPYAHTQDPRLRAFANFHTARMYCETCHLQPKEKSTQVAFGWYNGKEILAEGTPPTLKDTLVTYRVKDEMKVPLLMKDGSFDSRFKIVMTKRQCQVCHYGEGDLPKPDFKALGYDEDQIYKLTNSKALGMLIKRNIFYFYSF